MDIDKALDLFLQAVIIETDILLTYLPTLKYQLYYIVTNLKLRKLKETLV